MRDEAIYDPPNPEARGKMRQRKLPPKQANGHDPEPRETLQSICAADVEMRALDWLWPGRFALRKIGIIAGLPDEGKGQVLSNIVAQVSTGGDWPCNEGRSPRGNIIILTAEDDPSDTVVPRLLAAGADLRRVHFVEMVQNIKGQKRIFNLASDVELLREKIAAIGDVVLVAIDPVSAYLGVGKIDSYRATDVRAVLKPLGDLAHQMNIAIVGIMHFNKKVDVNNVLLRISDSLAFGATARHVYGVIDDEANERKLLVRAKNNLTERASKNTLGYRFGVREVGTDSKSGKTISAPFIIWEEGYVDITATEAMQAINENKTPAARDEAKRFLTDLLHDGPMATKDIREAAEGHSIAWRTVERAKRELKIIAKKDGADGGWAWHLSEQTTQQHWSNT